ncbi:MAG: Ig-like domain-containing protein [Gemmatimonadales bacterium]
MHGLRRPAAVVLLIAACARMAPPPGGPARHTPPVLTATLPADSVCALPGFRGTAEFFFDEVVSEGSQPNFGYGTGDLEKLILFSPDTTVPRVGWHRNHISVRPRHGWTPNTTYRIELARGVADLRNNFTKSAGVITFTTGPTCPTRFLFGRAVDWATRAAIPLALIEAFHLPDSARYRTVADSTGRFRLGPLPAGGYLVAATLDQNRDNRREPGEPWDTVRIGASRDTVGEIWAFMRDSLPPKIQDVTRQDSLSVAVTFTRPIDPYQHLDSTSLRVGLILPTDTATVAPLVAYPKAIYDSIYRPIAPPAAKPDSTARPDTVAADTTRRPVPPARRVRGAPPLPVVDSVQQKRPPLGSVLVIHTRGRIQLGRSYFVEVRGVRTAGGVTGPPVARRLDTPKAPSAADSAKARADSARADSLKRLKADSTKSRPDSVRPKAPPAAKPPPAVKPDSALRRRR